MPTISDYLQRGQGSSSLVAINVGTWIQIVNNATGAAFVSTAATDANGKFTVNNVPAGTYTVNTGPSATGPWTATGDTNYNVPAGSVRLDIRDFGGVADGSTDNSAAFTAALAALPSTGGEIVLPFGSTSPYVFASAWNLSSKSFVRIVGGGPTTGGGAAGSTLVRFTTTSGPLINATSSTAVEFEDIYVQWPNTFAGTVLSFDSPSGTPAGLNRVSRCFFEPNGGGTTAAVVISLDNTIITKIERSALHGTQVGIRGVGTGGHFSNAIQVRDCVFSSSTGDIQTAHIQNPGQGWLIEGCTFEMGTAAGTPFAIGQSLGGALGASVIGNWFGDAGAGAITFIDINGDGFFVAGNILGSNSNAGSVLINLQSGANGHTVAGNRMQNAGTGVNFTGSNRDISVLGNRLNGVTSWFGATPSSGMLQTQTGSGGVRYLGAMQRSSQAPAFAASYTPDPTLGESVEMTLTGNITVNAPTNGQAGQRLVLKWTQDGTGGRTVTYNVAFKLGTSTPALVTTLNTTTLDEFECSRDNATWRMVSRNTGQ